MRLPLDLRLALSPFETYQQLAAHRVRGTWVRALDRPALVAVIVGTAITMSSARRVPVALVTMGIVCWSFVPMIQWMIGAAVIGRTYGRPMTMPRCLELLFVGQLPWSLWILGRFGMTALTDVNIGRTVEVSSLLIPGIWTTIIVFAFYRAALGCTVVRARALTVVHQGLIWTTLLIYALVFSGVWARFLALIGA